MTKIKQFLAKLYKQLGSPQTLFFIGLILIIGTTAKELLSDRAFNYHIFVAGTQDFWAGLSPYDVQEWGMRHHMDRFLYGPLFCILFAPFAYLPLAVGAFSWTVFSYLAYYFAIFTLPDRFSIRQKCNLFLFTILILATTLLEFQYNALVGAIFLFAYTLMEKEKPFWAILLILISGFTKIYGGFQLGILLMYPRFWRNMGYVAGISAGLLSLPLLRLPITELIPFYREWAEALSYHSTIGVRQSVFYLNALFSERPPASMTLIQIGTISFLAIAMILSRKLYSSSAFRIRSIAVLMGWTILFSSAPERHTYVIALLGYFLWYSTYSMHHLIDKILLYAIFIILVLIPIDLICPVKLLIYLHDRLNINVWLFLATWIIMVWRTFSPSVDAFETERFDNR